MSAIERKVIRELRHAGFKVMTRRQWGSKHRGVYQRRRVTRRFVGAADWFFAHISVTHDTGSARRDAQTIERIGMERFGTGWSYNWGLHGSTETVILGQPHDAAGAHTLNDKNVPGFPENLNYWGHAIAQMGMPGDPFTPWMLRAAAAIIAAEKKHGAAKNGADQHSHSRFAWKECACDPYRNAIGRVMRTSRRILDPIRPNPAPSTSEEDDMPYTDWPEKDRKALCDDVAAALLSTELNAHEPKGEPEFRGVTVRATLKELIRATGARIARRAD